MMAVGVGFEPTEGFPSTVFKTAAFDHSASPPKSLQQLLLAREGRIITMPALLARAKCYESYLSAQ